MLHVREQRVLRDTRCARFMAFIRTHGWRRLNAWPSMSRNVNLSGGGFLDYLLLCFLVVQFCGGELEARHRRGHKGTAILVGPAALH